MKLKKLEIHRFRNIRSCLIECGKGIHFISGENGQGKTSVLEAINILSNLRSFREKDLEALIQHGEPLATVKGWFETDGFECELKVELDKSGLRFQKRAFVNGKLIRSAKDYYQTKLTHPAIQFHAISLNPASTDLIHGGPSVRRQYLNQVISVQDPNTLEALTKYQRVIDQKNALLKQGGFDSILLETLNDSLVTWGAKVRAFRLNYLANLAPHFDKYLSTIAPTQSKAWLDYEHRDFKGKIPSFRLDFSGHFNLPTDTVLETQIREELKLAGPLEKAREQALVGPHRDDWAVRTYKSVQASLAEVGSQGEVRSVLLALKLAEIECFTEITTVRPVFLIDDFSSELDSFRRGFLLNFLESADLQVFVTSTEELPSLQSNAGKTTVEARVETKKFRMDQGVCA